MKKTIYIFTYFDGDRSNSDYFVGKSDLLYTDMIKSAQKHLMDNFEIEPEQVDIEEIFCVDENSLNEVVESEQF